jgi:MYXO-CTERM domain-containing protein
VKRPEHHRQHAEADEKPKSWVVRHKWALGLGAVALAAFWWRRSRRRDFSVSSVSDAWLAEHAVESGKSSDDHLF